MSSTMLNDIIIMWSPFDSFPLFSHVLISLIKLSLWLTFPTDKKQAEDMGEGQ